MNTLNSKFAFLIMHTRGSSILDYVTRISIWEKNDSYHEYDPVGSNRVLSSFFLTFMSFVFHPYRLLLLWGGYVLLSALSYIRFSGLVSVLTPMRDIFYRRFVCRKNLHTSGSLTGLIRFYDVNSCFIHIHVSFIIKNCK